MEFPEHEKLKAVQAETQFLGGFIEWLGSKNMCIAIWDDRDRLHRSNKSVNYLLSMYKNIDPLKIDAEKRAMLEELVAIQIKENNGN